jgi:DNA-binding response OmpR family regulator
MTGFDPALSGEATKTLLVADDEILVRFSICDYLRGCGHKVIEAANADEALTLLQTPDLPIHLVLSSVQLKGSIDGFGLSRWMRTNRPGLAVILAGSAARAADAAAELCEDGPTLARPYEPQVLIDRIKRLLSEIGK